jgi:hypothetical protein
LGSAEGASWTLVTMPSLSTQGIASMVEITTTREPGLSSWVISGGKSTTPSR